MRLILAIGGVLLGVLSASADEIRTPEGIVIHTDESQHAIEISGLAYAETDCHPFEFAGTIIEREFGSDELTVANVVIEAPNGKRDVYSLNAIPGDLPMSTTVWLYQGLQQLTTTGRKARGRAVTCGAARRFLVLDTIR